MDFEFVALSWRTEEWIEDAQYVSDRGKLLCQGWEVHKLVPWPIKRIGGICIMRRPKDEPRMWMEGEAKVLAQHIAGKLTLWQLHVSEWTEAQLVSVIQEVLTRPVLESPSFSEPRKWTKAEIEEIAKGTKGSVLNERVMQADLCGRLEQRNAELQGRLSERQETICAQTLRIGELQSAIDMVVNGVRLSGIRDHEYVSRWVSKYLYPLGTKPTMA